MKTRTKAIEPQTMAIKGWERGHLARPSDLVTASLSGFRNSRIRPGGGGTGTPACAGGVALARGAGVAVPPGEQAFTLMELIATMAIMMILAGAALPIMRVHAQRERELELRRDLREIRSAIDRYKDMADRGMIPTEANTFNYPPDLETLVNGVPLKGASSAKYKFLRHIPNDPMTGRPDWGKRSMQDDPDSKSWGGEDVFDVYSQSSGTALDGTQYSDW